MFLSWMEVFNKVVIPMTLAILGVGGIGAIIKYFIYKPKITAEAQKINVEATLTFAEGWRGYAQNLEKRLDYTDKKLQENEDFLSHLQKEIRDQDIANRLSLQEKDKLIEELQATNRRLERRINELEADLKLYNQRNSNAS